MRNGKLVVLDKFITLVLLFPLPGSSGHVFPFKPQFEVMIFFTQSFSHFYNVSFCTRKEILLYLRFTLFMHHLNYRWQYICNSICSPNKYILPSIPCFYLYGLPYYILNSECFELKQGHVLF